MRKKKFDRILLVIFLVKSKLLKTKYRKVVVISRLFSHFSRQIKIVLQLNTAMPFWFHEFSRIFWNFVVFSRFCFQLIFPAEFPFKPPSIYMTTPNGRFKTHTRLCLSISDYHPDTWNPGWSVGTILIGLLSFMLERSPTLGSIGNVRIFFLYFRWILWF